jgi:hypothetical protein
MQTKRQQCSRGGGRCQAWQYIGVVSERASEQFLGDLCVMSCLWVRRLWVITTGSAG